MSTLIAPPVARPLPPRVPLHLAHCSHSVLSASGFLLEKKVGVNQPKRLENVRILIANTAMDTDKIKVEMESLVSLSSLSTFILLSLPPSSLPPLLPFHPLSFFPPSPPFPSSLSPPFVSPSTPHFKVFGHKVRVDSTAKVAELELAEKVSPPIAYIL